MWQSKRKRERERDEEMDQVRNADPMQNFHFGHIQIDGIVGQLFSSHAESFLINFWVVFVAAHINEYWRTSKMVTCFFGGGGFWVEKVLLLLLLLLNEMWYICKLMSVVFLMKSEFYSFVFICIACECVDECQLSTHWPHTHGDKLAATNATRDVMLNFGTNKTAELINSNTAPIYWLYILPDAKWTLDTRFFLFCLSFVNGLIWSYRITV